MDQFIEIEDKFYILSSSSFADDRTIVIKQGDSFGIFDRYGDIHTFGQGAQGIYHEGTRYLSKASLTIDNQRPLLLSSNLKEENELLSVDLTNPDYADKQGGIVQRGTLHILRTKFLWKGVCYERIRFSNFGLEAVSASIRLQFQGDFADIFEVRGMHRSKRGTTLKEVYAPEEIHLSYQGLDQIQRNTRLLFSPAPVETAANQVKYEIRLAPKEVLDVEISAAFETGEKKPSVLSYDAAHEELLSYQERIKRYACDIFTSNEQFNNWVNRSEADLITMITLTEHGPYPYAGVPWYSTPFGRDGIITAFECLWLTPEVAKGVLTYLAATQATEENALKDAEPGKILHETRGGEMAELGEIPFKLYYGTIDATPLFVSLAGSYYERTNDIETIQKLWPNIEAALHWIDEYGDLDGDGFVEYARKNESGLINQGWKDSHDSVFYEDGQMAEGPIALCEVQGYVYDAKLKGAQMAEALGHAPKAQRLLKEAQALKEKFAQVFWSEEKQIFVLALDGKKQPCRVVTSNAGHCLFSGIATQEHAEKTAKTLLTEKMFSGWGLRTLATDEIRYNPMSYHNGSVWPHDNAMVAYGLSRYGMHEEVLKMITGIFDTSLFVDLQRLPELFCGFTRRKGEGPTDYPVACSPQAWAVASVFLLIQSCLGLHIDAKKNTIFFNKPTLPPFLDYIMIRNLKINGQPVGLQIHKQMGSIAIQLLDKESEVKIEVLS